MKRITLSILAILLGVFLFIYGGADDSPGAQGLGLLLVLFGVYWFWKMKKKKAV
ncbi:MAG: hypothetical protein WCV85_02925 [Patescibacteria group bacterium]|jgi:hypothetical protein